MAVNNNLFPPIVDSYMPAFLIDSGDIVKDTCRVYFSLSNFNSEKDIKNAQVTVRNQSTNLSMLNEVKYPCEIMITDIKIDNEKTTDDKYYVEIKKTDMLNNNFNINQYYKVQIRFTGANAEDPPTGETQQIDGWLAANLSLFSEWSTVCLIRGISSPTLSINNFNSSSEVTYLEESNVDVLGTLTFADAAETETLKSYRVKLLDESGNILTDSEIQYTNNYNSINSFSYTLKYELVEGNSYGLLVEYTTQNLYHEEIYFDFIAIQTYSDRLNADLKYVIDEANAAIGINIKAQENVKSTAGNITIRRTSSESNFTIWEDVHTFTIDDEKLLDYTWFDYTIESGIWYRYCAQKRSSSGKRGVIVQLYEPKMLTFEDMYLTGYNQQLKIEFNPTVQSFKRNVLESNTVTIGSKYPFIKRSGYAYYRSFPISGLISSEMDEDNIFTTREEVLGKDNLIYYNEYNKENNIPYNYDFTYEREFREKVEEFLMKNTVKLFRSPTEGNILIKLMDVNFQPNQTLGRRLYSFSATAYEIADYTIENCDKYHIQSLGKYHIPATYPEQYFGQIQAEIPANKDVLQIIEEKYKQKADNGYEIKVNNLNYLKLEMEDKPYLIQDNGDEPVVAEARSKMLLAVAAPSIYTGYIVYINDIPIVISPKGNYELINDDVKITSLRFPVDTKVNMDYNANVSKVIITSEEEVKETKSVEFEIALGQIYGGFSYNDPVIKRIWNKHYESYSDYSQSLYYLNDIGIEAEPNTIVYIKEDKDTDYEKHIIGPTCLLSLQNEKANIVGLYFIGLHFDPADENQLERDNVLDNFYKDTGITLDENILIRDYKFIRNGVYTLTPEFIKKYPEKISKIELTNSRTMKNTKGTILAKIDEDFEKIISAKLAENENKYIWYNDRFWLISQDGDVLCPVEATINYTCDIIKERYE